MNAPRRHFVHNYFLQPTNPIVVQLIGAGGTGSQVLTLLARLNHALTQLDHAGLQVYLWDPDQVTPANLGRQLFAPAEVGQPKASVLINRTNRFFGTNWKAVVAPYDEATARSKRPSTGNLVITCVDTVSARIEIAKILQLMHRHQSHMARRDTPYYWLDFGNSHHTGQVMLATVGKIIQPKSEKFTPVDSLPFITDEYTTELENARQDNTPSCSLAEALLQQDLFINSTLANMGSALLWSMFRNGMIENRGFFLNLADFRTQPLKV